MPAFKPNDDFLAFVSMGAIAARQVEVNLRSQGRQPLSLERGAMDFKLWKAIRNKGFRVPDFICVDTGRFVESRAKKDFEISSSHSTSDSDRIWDVGLRDTDYIAHPIGIKS